jgi:hypothetical protein
MKKLPCVILFACLTTVLFSQIPHVSSSPNALRLPLDSAVNNILTQVLLFPQEKIYLQTDKPYYISGEKIFFRAFLLNAFSHQPADMSRYMYVELINAKDSVKIRQQIRPENTLFFGTLSLPEDLPEGDYNIRAYTRFMENQGKDYFFTRQIYIADPVQKEDEEKAPKANQPLKFDVSFYPEGGNLVAEQFSSIAFKALDSNGSAVDIRGEVFDSQNEKITDFTTIHEGIGRFTLTPEFGKQYYAVCYKGYQSIKVNLPEVKNNTYALSTVWRQNKLWITVNKPANLPAQKFYLLAHTGGMVIYSGEWDFSKEVIAMDKNDFPSGVSHLLLLTEDYQPVSERLVFALNNDWETAEIQLPKQKYKSRELVKMVINVPHGIASQARNDREEDGYREERGDSVGRNDSLVSNFAISVTDDKDIQIDITSTILSNILLTSELRGYVANPAYYFQKDNRQAEQTADLLMMTHGWNRYNIPKAMRSDFQYLTIPNEESQSFSGLVKGGLLSKPYAKSKVTILSTNTSFYDVTETDENGRFTFKNFEFPDSTSYIIQALNKKGKDIVELYLDKILYPAESSEFYPKKLTDEIAKADFKEYVEKADLKYTYENGMRMRTLPELVVRGHASSQYQSPFYTSPDNFLTEVDINRSSDMRSLLRKSPELRMQNRKLRVRDTPAVPVAGPPMIMIDGQKIVYGGDDDINDDEVWNILDHLDIEEIAHVDIISSPAKKLAYGKTYGQNGVIEIFTKKGYWNISKPRFNTQQIIPLGYQQPVEFYSPQYDTPEARKSSIPDLRSTIYWKPDVLVDSEGKASVDFYTADSPSTYSVIIEGITPEGKLIYQQEKTVVVVE